MIKFFMLTCLLIALAGCQVDIVDIEGTFRGTAEGKIYGAPFSNSFTMRLSQNGNAVEGTWFLGKASSGTLKGNIEKDSNRFGDLFLFQEIPCESTFMGAAEILSRGDQLTGNYDGADCFGIVSVEFDISK